MCHLAGVQRKHSKGGHRSKAPCYTLCSRRKRGVEDVGGQLKPPDAAGIGEAHARGFCVVAARDIAQ